MLNRDEGSLKPDVSFSGLIASAQAAIASGRYDEAVRLCRDLQSTTTRPDLLSQIIRTEISAHQTFGAARAQERAYRRLRKIDNLKPNEHRRFFGHLVSTKGKLVRRYVGFLESRTPTVSNWRRIALIFWSTRNLEALFRWAKRHPEGNARSARELFLLGQNSAEHKEGRVCLDICLFLMTQDPPAVDEALELIEALEEAKELSLAREAVTAFLEKNADNARAREIAARISTKIGQAPSLIGTEDPDVAVHTAALRQLRKVSPLKLNQNRRLFRGLVKTGKGHLVDRYLSRLRKAEPTRTNWSPIAVVFWASEDIGELLRWADRHPLGPLGAARTFLTLATNSLEHREKATAIALLQYVSEIADDQPELHGRIVELFCEAGAAREALDLVGGRWRSVDQNITKKAVESRINEIIAEIDADNAAAMIAEIDAIETALGGMPAISSARLIATAWLEQPVRLRPGTIAPAVEEGSGPIESREMFRAFLEGSGAAKEGGPAIESRDMFRESQEIIRAAWLRREAEGGADELVHSWEGISDALIRIDSGDHGIVLEGLRALMPVAAQYNLTGRMSKAFARLLKDFAGHIGSAEWAELREELNAVAAEAPYLSEVLTEFLSRHGDEFGALELQLVQPTESRTWRGWIAAAQAAARAGATSLTIEFCKRAVSTGGVKAAREASALLLADGLVEESIEAWSWKPEGVNPYEAQLGALRALHAAGRKSEVVKRGLRLLDDMAPFIKLNAAEQKVLVSLARLILTSEHESRSYGANIAHLPDYSRNEPNNALAYFVDGMLRYAKLDVTGARDAFQAGAALQSKLYLLPVDFRGELALLEMRHHRYGKASGILRGVEFAPEADAFYRRRLEALNRLELLTAEGDFPECLIDIILEEALRHPFRYDSEPGHLMTVLGHLAQGGSERQAVNIIKAMCGQPRIRKQTVLVRLAEGEHGFFLPALQESSADIIIYGTDWRTRTDFTALLPELADRERLMQAVELLTPSMREELIRTTKHFIEHRPQVVHLRQDLFLPALACVVAGVPKFFIHRGSLARNTWEHNILQADRQLRPMRHTYRQLLAHTGFFIVNNSEEGRQTDLDWIGHEWEDRVFVVDNAVDFAAFGEDVSPNHGLRAKLGIPKTAPVVGGVFRMVKVKRPQLWMEVARLVLQKQPRTHFVVVGDGELRSDMQAFAEQHGFGDRLHLPGAVTDVSAWYRIMNALLLTSDREGLPNVVIEAQYFGIPAVSSDVGGARRTLVDGVTGWLVPPDSPAETYAAKLLSVFSEKAWRTRAKRKAQAFVVGRFSTERTVKRLLDLYDIR